MRALARRSQLLGRAGGDRSASLAVTLSAAAVLACALAFSLPHSAAASPPRIGHGVEGVPLGARGIVSAFLGRDLVQQAELTDHPGGSGEQFGEALAVSGRTLVAGTTTNI